MQWPSNKFWKIYKCFFCQYIWRYNLWSRTSAIMDCVPKHDRRCYQLRSQWKVYFRRFDSIRPRKSSTRVLTLTHVVIGDGQNFVKPHSNWIVRRRCRRLGFKNGNDDTSETAQSWRFARKWRELHNFVIVRLAESSHDQNTRHDYRICCPLRDVFMSPLIFQDTDRRYYFRENYLPQVLSNRNGIHDW